MIDKENDLDIQPIQIIDYLMRNSEDADFDKNIISLLFNNSKD